jgi:TolB-like protein/Tfp pilus assembly protein PilF
MAIWAAEIKDLEKLYESLKGQFPDLQKELERLVKADDENMILLYSRRCLEVIITDLCECELKRPRKTEPLKGIIDKLHKEGKVPAHIITSMHGLNELSTYGAHPKDFDPEQIKPVLINLDIIIKWYLKYRVSRAIKEETEEEKPQHRELLEETRSEKKKEAQREPAKINRSKLLSGAAILIVLIIAGLIAYPKIYKRGTLERLRASGERISVAVMPFQNITKDSIWNNWQDGIKDELINYLTNYNEELEVRQSQSINGILQSKGFTNYASLTPSIASAISQKLDAKVFVYGSIKQAGDKIRVNAQLIDTKSTEALKSFQIEGPSNVENILHITDSLSRMVKNFLIISSLEKEIQQYFRHLVSTNSPEAYSQYKIGHDAFYKLDYSTSINCLLQAIYLDSNFVEAMVKISYAYGNQGMYKEAKYWSRKAYEKKNLVPRTLQLWTDVAYATYYERTNEVIISLKKYLDVDDQFPDAHYRLGGAYNRLFEYKKAIPEGEKALEIFNNWGAKPMWIPNYIELGIAYHKTKEFKKEKELYKKAEQDFPDDPLLIRSQAILSLAEGDTAMANRYIEKYISLRKDRSATEANIANGLASIYSDAEILNKGEEYYRLAHSLEPEDTVWTNNLAYFLIDKQRNINEGLELVDKALNLQPENYNYLHTKGWGLYRQGKSEESLEILQKSWDLRMKNDIYNHEAFLHLEAAKKAVASQKNN